MSKKSAKNFQDGINQFLKIYIYFIKLSNNLLIDSLNI